MVHIVPHMPQLSRSLRRFTHSVPHAVVPDPQVQTPAVQLPPKPQVLPQAPQLRVLVSVSTQKNPQRI